jgi:PAS domain S-box-containing protein
MDAVRFTGIANGSFHIAWKDGERDFCRGWHKGSDGNLVAALAVRPSSEHPHPAITDRLACEYAWKDELDRAWALRPLDLLQEGGRTVLVLEDPGGEPLTQLIGGPMLVGGFLRLAIGIATAVGKLHQRGLVHKDIKPTNIIVDRASGEIRLTGFGIASRLRRERQTVQPPETIAGTLAYMAPEQTGWMNRSIDSRSDLYALGVTLYEMLTGSLPFVASDPMEWVHCHIARKPMLPSDRVRSIPSALSLIVMKLLAKTAEDRYQTAGGLAWDLRHCLAELEDRSHIELFPLGQHDTSDRLTIPERLYGREREIETLLASFDRIVEGGVLELVLVSGYSGIGKSSVVSELHKVLVPPRALFASGKFDQYKRDIPYSTLAQALQSLTRSLLGKSEAELARWRAALLEAVSPNGRLMVDLVPDLKLIVGEQPIVPELPPKDAQRRFQLVLRRLIGVFARPEHPLALFLDDLQWLDAATLDLLEDLLTHSDLQHLMIIGAYRDNEVTTAHPLRRKLDAVKIAGGRVAEIKLAPLAREHLGQLIADALRCEMDCAAPLAQLLHEKTGGNPFFSIQFMSSLAHEGVLTFDHDLARWSWDFDRIDARGYTDNVVDLLIDKLTRLPAETQNALELLSCLGNVSDTTTLSIVLATSEAEVHAALWPSVYQELVELLAGAYRFIHDRVQEAAYSLIPEEARAAFHLRLGRILVTHTPPSQREAAIFDIVNQLNRAKALIISRAEREQLAEFNLIAGKRAKASTAYDSALTYFAAGVALLTDDGWVERHELMFALELNRAECEYLTGAVAEAELDLTVLSTRSANRLEQATVACLRMDLYVTLDKSGSAVGIGLDYLRQTGIDWLPNPTDEQARREYERIWSQLGGRAIEELIELPLMTDPAALATLDVLTRLASAALFGGSANLYFLVISRAVNLSLEYGNSDGSCAAYVRLGTLVGARFSDYQAAFRFGRLGYELVEKHGLKRFQARVYLLLGNVIMPWTRHVHACRDLVRRSFDAANELGDLTFAVYSHNHLIANMLAAGDPLAEVQRDAENGLGFAQKAHFGLVVDVIATQVALIRTLRGSTSKFGCLDDGHTDEFQMEHRLSSNPEPSIAVCWYWVRKMQARYFAGDYAAAANASSKAQVLLWMSTSHWETAEWRFYSALAHSACWNSASPDQRQQHFETLADHYRQLKVEAENCPENFENRAALVAAEIARIQGRELEAERLYEQAIRSARANGFIHNGALAYELAARFYDSRGFEDIAHLYLRKARYFYLLWGADAKVRQLEEMHPHLREEEHGSAPTSTIAAAVQQLDLGTVIKVLQAVSGEIVLEKLLETIMLTAIEQAGAERGLLISSNETEPQIEAEAATRGDSVVVQLHDQMVTPTKLPSSVLHHVFRTRETVVLDDAVTEPLFASDPYVHQRQAKSILCLPLINQRKLVGALYLENNLTANVFAPARMAALKLLASQAAISLGNSRLYGDLKAQEAKVRGLFDANLIGIVFWDFEGRILEANETFLRMMGFDRDDFVSGRVRWTDLIPPEGLDRIAQALEEIKIAGTIQPFERDYLRKDGSRVPVLMGAALLEQDKNQGVSFVLDLSERRRAESEARESERRYRETQLELAHANRVATMGQLTASIAHEVNQPITAMIGNAEATMRWLAHQPPDLEEARQLLERIAKEGRRASTVVERTRDLVRKAPPRMERVEINGAIGEVIELTRAEASKSQISVQTRLAENLPLVKADRTQLQQVMLNLIVNAVHSLNEGSQARRELSISTSMNDSSAVLVSVCDSGKGLSPEQLDRLFDPFYTTKSDGMGMGLSICRSIIESHGGRIWAASNHPQGAAFYFTIPQPDKS